MCLLFFLLIKSFANKHSWLGNEWWKVDQCDPGLCFFIFRTGIKSLKTINECQCPPLLVLMVRSLCTIFSFWSWCLASSDFVPAQEQHRELLNRPQFIRGGRLVNCVADSESVHNHFTIQHVQIPVINDMIIISSPRLLRRIDLTFH